MKNALNTGNPDNQFVYGNPGWLPIAGRWSQQGPIPTNTPTLGPPATNTPMVFPCVIPIFIKTSSYRGPSSDDMTVNSETVNTSLTFIASALDELDERWYGFDDSHNRGFDKNDQPVLSWISANYIQEQENYSCLSDLPDRSVKFKIPLPAADTWAIYLGTTVPQLPIAPSTLLPPNPSYRGFGIIDQGDYSLISGCRHPGFDFFTPSGASVMSIADGIVVGMGSTQDYHAILRPGSWGSVTGQDVTSSTEFNLVIRSGSHFVLYGHLATIANSLYYGSQIQAGDVIGTVDPQSNNNTHLHVEVDSFLTVAEENSSLRPYFGAIMKNGAQNADLVTDLMSFLPTAAQGVPTYAAPALPDCYMTGTPASSRRYVGAQMGSIAGNATLVYASRDGEHDNCFRTFGPTPNVLFPDIPPTQCVARPPSTAISTPVRTPTPAN